MDDVTQLVEAIRTHVHKHPDPNLYSTKEDVWEMALEVLSHSSIPDKEGKKYLVYYALEKLWDEIPGLETRGSWKEIF